MGEGKPLTVAQGDEWQGNLACECFAAILCSALITRQYSCMHQSKVHADNQQETCNAEGTLAPALQHRCTMKKCAEGCYHAGERLEWEGIKPFLQAPL